MNNNRNTNRRRGRNNNRGPGGGNQGNRIDSRARGNAPQMLEKYKKMAHDASLNGDRVQTEYYLQFADHYFRVIADMKTQRDDQQPRGRRDDREQDDYGDDENEVEEVSTQRQPSRSPRRDERDEDEGNRGSEGNRSSEGNRGNQGNRGAEGEPASTDEDENPFIRESKPRRPRRAARADEAGEGSAKEGKPAQDVKPAKPARAAPRAKAEGGLDPASLPPAIGADDEKPRPRRRTRRTPEADSGDETLEAVG